MHARSKYIEIDVHYIRDQVLQNQVIIAYVPTADQIADCLTKPLTHTRFNILRDKHGMTGSPQFERELEKVTILIIRINTRDIMSIILSQYLWYYVRVLFLMCTTIIINYFLYCLLYSIMTLL